MLTLNVYQKPKVRESLDIIWFILKKKMKFKFLIKKMSAIWWDFVIRWKVTESKLHFYAIIFKIEIILLCTVEQLFNLKN